MAFRKITVVLSGNGSAGLVKLSGAFDGVGKVKGECGGVPAGGGELYIIGDEIAKVTLDKQKQTFETRVLALSDVFCVLHTADGTMTGGTGNKVDRTALERRVSAFENKIAAETAAPTGKSAPVRSPDSPSAAPRNDAPSPERKSPDNSRSAKETPSRAADGANAEDASPHERNSARETDVGGQNRRQGAARAAAGADVNVRSVLEEGVTYDGTNFFFAVKPQLDEMFVRYPAEERLNAIVPNSKWVRVDTEEGDYYVLGVLYDLSTPIFICYGIPGTRNVAPPREIADVCVWLPLSSEQPDGNGFWIIYQSAENGKCVR